MTRKIYLLVHKPNTYTETRKIIRAYESEEEATAIVLMLDGITTGTIEVQPVELIGAAKLPEGWRSSSPPVLATQGAMGKAEVGRAELP